MRIWHFLKLIMANFVPFKFLWTRQPWQRLVREQFHFILCSIKSLSPRLQSKFSKNVKHFSSYLLLVQDCSCGMPKILFAGNHQVCLDEIKIIFASTKVIWNSFLLWMKLWWLHDEIKSSIESSIQVSHFLQV